MHYQLPDRALTAEDAQLLQQWTSGVWTQLRSLIVDEMAPIFTKINMLEYVLRSKHTSKSGATLQESLMHVCRNTYAAIARKAN